MPTTNVVAATNPFQKVQMATKVKFPKHAVMFVPPADLEGVEPELDGFYDKISEAKKIADLDENTYAVTLAFHPKKVKKAKKA
jgi:hypothetical protein